MACSASDTVIDRASDRSITRVTLVGRMRHFSRTHASIDLSAYVSCVDQILRHLSQSPTEGDGPRLSSPPTAVFTRDVCGPEDSGTQRGVIQPSHDANHDETLIRRSQGMDVPLERCFPPFGHGSPLAHWSSAAWRPLHSVSIYPRLAYCIDSRIKKMRRLMLWREEDRVEATTPPEINADATLRPGCVRPQHDGFTISRLNACLMILPRRVGSLNRFNSCQRTFPRRIGTFNPYIRCLRGACHWASAPEPEYEPNCQQTRGDTDSHPPSERRDISPDAQGNSERGEYDEWEPNRANLKRNWGLVVVLDRRAMRHLSAWGIWCVIR